MSYFMSWFHVHHPPSMEWIPSILCLIQRKTVTSLSAPKDTRCKTYPLSVNPGAPFWTRETKHKLRARWQASLSGIRADVTVVLRVRQSIIWFKTWLSSLSLFIMYDAQTKRVGKHDIATIVRLTSVTLSLFLYMHWYSHICVNNL